MKTIEFTSKELLSQFLTNGVVLIEDFLDKQKIAELLNIIYPIKHSSTRAFWTSSDEPDQAYRLAVSKNIEKVISEEYIAQFVKGYKIFYSNLLCKNKGNFSECVIHTDWSIIDEKQFTPLHVWVPLVDVWIENGALAVVKKSHLLTNAYRGLNINEYYNEYSKQLIDNCLTYMEIKAGTAVFYFPGLLHYSPPNFTDATRVAVLLSLYPQEAKTSLYYKNKISLFNAISEFELSKAFFTEWDKQTKPTTAVRRMLSEKVNKLSKEDFIKKLAVK